MSEFRTPAQIIGMIHALMKELEVGSQRELRQEMEKNELLRHEHSKVNARLMASAGRVREMEERLAEANTRADRADEQLREEREQNIKNETRSEIVLDPPSGKERDSVDWSRPFIISGNRCKIRAVNTDANGYVIYLEREKS